jgi:hypothetical protein
MITTDRSDTMDRDPLFVALVAQYTEERRAAEEAAKVRKPFSLHECYDPGDGSMKKGRTRRFATLAAAVAAGEEQRREYGSSLVVGCPYRHAFQSVAIHRNYNEITWARR